jgi:DNA polymerase V
MRLINYTLSSHQISQFDAKVSAGFPSPASEQSDNRLSLDELLITHPLSTFFVEASGMSMINAGINPGDILIVDRSRQAIDRDIVIAIIDGDLTVKRLSLTNSDKPELHAENPSFAPIKFTHHQELSIWGVVTSVIHRFKK